jgi:RHS repeat-associated protein
LTKHLKFAYSGFKCVGEIDAASGEIARNYVWLGDELLGTVDAKGKAYSYLTDGNRNIIKVLNETGNSTAEYSYSPFSEQIESSGDFADKNPFRFSSEYFDSETGLVYYNYRYFSPEFGRWTSREPLKEQGSVNFYAFGPNSPINGVDRLGLAWLASKQGEAQSFRFWLKGKGGTAETYQEKEIPPEFVTEKYNSSEGCCCRCWIKEGTGIYDIGFIWYPVKLIRAKFWIKPGPGKPDAVLKTNQQLLGILEGRKYTFFDETSTKTTVRLMEPIYAAAGVLEKINQHEQGHISDFKEIYDAIVAPLEKEIQQLWGKNNAASACSKIGYDDACSSCMKDPKFYPVVRWNSAISREFLPSIEGANKERDKRESLNHGKPHFWGGKGGSKYFVIEAGW